MSILAAVNLRNLTFRQQLIAASCALVVTMVGIISYVNSVNSHKVLIKQMHAQGAQVANTLAAHSKLALLYESEYNARESVDFVAKFPDVEILEIVTAKGKRLYRSRAATDRDLNQHYDPYSDLLRLEYTNDWVFILPVFSSADIEEGYGLSGDETEDLETHLGYVALSLRKDTIQLLQWTAIKTNILLAVIIVLAVIVVIIAMSRQITRPIEQLASTMKRAEDGDTSARALVKGQPDVAVMQHAFNTMMDKLEIREHELKQARDKAVESARIKGEFATNVTHELRTPMNAVLGMMDLLAESKLTPSQHDYVNVARNSGENLLQLIDDILDFSKMDAGRITTETKNTNIREFLEDIVKLLANQALTKDVDIGYFIDPRIPSILPLAESRVQQVLINLLGNAIKFTEAGEVSLWLSLSDGNPTNLLFEVKDSGIGIIASDQEKIFEAFTQADASSTREYSGTGLGLAICRQLVQIMGGEIGLRSQPGKGSTFWFSLPSEIDLAASAIITESKTNTSTLLVSSTEITQQFIADRLADKGSHYAFAEDYASAVTKLKSSLANGSSYDYIVIEEHKLSAHYDEFVGLFDKRGAFRQIKVGVLTNPCKSSEKIDKHFLRIDKPLFASSLNELFNNEPVTGKHSLSDSGPSADTRPAVPVGNTTILVVDDNRINQQVAAEMLKTLGCASEVAANGRQALELVSRKPYDLILMDCNMPVMDGYECTREIRNLTLGQSLPILAMTANTNDDEKQRCKNAGMDSFLEKPLRLGVLKETLSNWLPEFSNGTKLPQPVDALILAQDSNYDPAVMQELFASVGDVVYRMIEAFMEDTPIYLDSMRAALIASDAKQVRELAHTIKGSASNFGAHGFVDIAKKIEELAQKGQLESCHDEIEKISASFTALVQAFDTEILNATSNGTATANRAYSLLIVDDDRTIRLALKDIFKDSEFDTLEATNGKEAIDLCRRTLPDIILMDAIMPESDGFSACETIRKLPNCADIPILMITSLDDEEAIVRAFSSGATDYVTKPLHFTVLKERVARLIKANKAGKKVKEMAYHDTLTGLPNRAKLMQELRVILNRSSLDQHRTAVLFLDLDHFKNINDSLGHNVGDLLLKVVADRLRGCVRENDLIARLGGDEFTVVLENIDSDHSIAKVAKSICDALSEPFVFLQQRMFVSASIGISVFPNDASDVNTLLKHADLAMFKAKKDRNSFCFYQSGMEDEISKRLKTESELRHAIDHNQLVLHFQPQYDLNSRSIVAAETLVRWQHPTRGLLGPMEFIPIAEESELITDLTQWVLHKAAQHISDWAQDGYAVKLSINLSARDLEAKVPLASRLAEIVKQYNIEPELLELELTESTLMADPEKSRNELLKLKSMGFTLSIDDFGTGYSSLNYLKNLPIDVLKIDRMFIKDLEQNVDDRSIVKGIIALAESLNLDTIAEGVETLEQRDIVAKLGCQMIQGYLISRPIPIEKFENNYKKDFVVAGKNSRADSA